MQMTRDTHFFVAGSQVAFDAQSVSFAHALGHSSVPLHRYAGQVGDSELAGRGVHVPGVALQVPHPPHSV